MRKQKSRVITWLPQVHRGNKKGNIGFWLLRLSTLFASLCTDMQKPEVAEKVEGCESLYKL